MEITLDMGKNTYTELAQHAQKAGLEIDHFMLDMLQLGLRVHIANQTHQNDSKISEELRLLLENNYLIKEVLQLVFDREHASINVFDAATLIQIVAERANAHHAGANMR